MAKAGSQSQTPLNADVTNEGLYVGAVAGAQTFAVLGGIVGGLYDPKTGSLLFFHRRRRRALPIDHPPRDPHPLIHLPPPSRPLISHRLVRYLPPPRPLFSTATSFCNSHKTVPKFGKFSPSVKVMLVTLPAVFAFALKMEQHVVDIALRRRSMGAPHAATSAEHDKYGTPLTHPPTRT